MHTMIIVKSTVNIAQVPVRNMGVCLRRRHTAMPEHLLDTAQIGSVGKQARRIGMSQDMRRDALRDTSLSRHERDHHLDGTRREPPCCRLPGADIDEERLQAVAPGEKIGSYPLGRPR